jgi:hypothetical protein
MIPVRMKSGAEVTAVQTLREFQSASSRNGRSVAAGTATVTVTIQHPVEPNRKPLSSLLWAGTFPIAGESN